MSATAALMAAQQAQSQAQMAQQSAMNMAQSQQSHNQQMMVSAAEGDRARRNTAEKMSNDMNADSATKMKQSQETASRAAAA